MMSKLYVGNLPNDVTERTLQSFFSEHGINTTNVIVKKGGYAFVDCEEQGEIDRAIEELNGCAYSGHNLVVEPSVAGGGIKRSVLETRVRVGGVPVDASLEDLENLLQTSGDIEKCEKYASRDGQTQVVHVSYASVEAAKDAAERLNGQHFESGVLRVERLMDRRSRGPGGPPPQSRNPMGSGPGRGGGMGLGPPNWGGGGAPMSSQRHTEFPLRILVLSEMVGAIIGKQGATIKAITQQSRARVDVHRKENAGALEKAITIYGNPENCTNACKKILEVMQDESNNTNKGEIPLKILAHNNLIGRIIGKGGGTIKKIMEDTATKITVSSINDINSFNLERIITIKGNTDDISRAENILSAKLRHCYESDLAAFAPQSSMFPGLHPMAMMSTVGIGLPRGGAAGSGGRNTGGQHAANMHGSNSGGGYYPPLYTSPVPGQSSSPQMPIEEHAYLYIPNCAVGAIIGTEGTHIRNMIRFSGASVKIAPSEEGKSYSEQPERKVTIVGTPEAQWKAQFLIFEKVRQESYGIGVEDVRLIVEIHVPSTQVGRIIGKGGQNVRDLQRQTGSIIKLPQQNGTTAEDTIIHIIGPFFSVQSAQRRIRSIIQSYQMPMGGASSMGGGRPSSPKMKK